MRQRRKIDPTLLLKFLDEGRSQRSCARHFSVSDSAISQAVKRLLPPPMPDSFEALPEHKKLYALAKADGLNNPNAVLKSHPNVTDRASARVIAHRLNHDEAVKLAIEDLLELKGLGRDYRFTKLKNFVEHRDPGIGLSALREACKIGRDYPQASGDTTNFNILNMNDIPQEEIEYLQTIAKKISKEAIKNLHLSRNEEQIIEIEPSKEQGENDGDEV